MEFTFDEKTHTYKLDGKRMTGVTTVLGIIAKPALIQWSANMAVEYVMDNFTERLLKYPLPSKDEMDLFFKEAKTAHRRKKEDAGQKGTDVHKEIEVLVKKAIEKFGGVIGEFHPENKQVDNFVTWATKNEVQFLESEKVMYSKKHFVGGTCDFTCIMNGNKYVGDIKTSSGIYGREPFAQCAAYRMMLEEMGEKEFEGSIIVNIPKTGKFNEDKDVHFSPYYEKDLELFLSALSVYRVINSFEKVNKFNK